MTSQPEQAAIIMAAGKSTRMKSRLPKAAHSICGRPIARHVVEACREAGIGRIVVIVGHEADAVMAAIGDSAEYVIQDEQLGTGHAVRCAESAFDAFSGIVAVLPGDTPLIRPDTIKQMMESCVNTAVPAVLLTAVVPEAAMYGRIVRDTEGNVVCIVEAKDASPEVKAIQEICTSMYAFRADMLFPALRKLTPENRQREYYLTDVIGLFSKAGERVEATVAHDYRETLGINTRVELAEATTIMRRRILEEHMLNGVTMLDPASVYIDAGAEIGPDTTIYPGTIIEGPCKIGSGCTLGPYSRIVSSVLEDGVRIDNSCVAQSTVGEGTFVGPYSRVRPGSNLGKGVKVGDFVEIKNSTIHDEVSLAHMTYIGDAEIGARTNVGAGTITCNYDGRRKHRTTIGQDAFIGSHTTLNAPVTVGDGAFTGSGSVIVKDVPADALAIARAGQVIKEGWARRRREQAKG